MSKTRNQLKWREDGQLLGQYCRLSELKDACPLLVIGHSETSWYTSSIPNARAFGVALDAEDQAQIEAVLAKSRDLYQLIGDCGDAYRR